MVDLSQLAERINKKWPGTAHSGREDLLTIKMPNDFLELALYATDIFNGEFIVWGMGRLEELNPKGVGLEGTEVRLYAYSDEWHTVEGKTKAEAVATALYEALGGEA